MSPFDSAHRLTGDNSNVCGGTSPCTTPQLCAAFRATAACRIYSHAKPTGSAAHFVDQAKQVAAVDVFQDDERAGFGCAGIEHGCQVRALRQAGGVGTRHVIVR